MNMGILRNVEMEAVTTDAQLWIATEVATDSRHRLRKRSLKWYMPTTKTLPAMIR